MKTNGYRGVARKDNIAGPTQIYPQSKGIKQGFFDFIENPQLIPQNLE